MRAVVWILIWLVLLLGSGWYLWSALRRTWRTSTRLMDELVSTEHRLSAIRTEVDRLGDRADALEELAVFGDASALRKERERTRQALTEQRRARRAENRPTWARHVDS